MNNTVSRLPLYLMIISATIGLFFVIYWMYDKPLASQLLSEQIVTNNIITAPENLPITCTQTLRLLDCIMSNPTIRTKTPGITEYYQKLISERNLITDTTALTSTCTTQYRYIQSLQDTGYQKIIHACSQ